MLPTLPLRQPVRARRVTVVTAMTAILNRLAGVTVVTAMTAIRNRVAGVTDVTAMTAIGKLPAPA